MEKKRALITNLVASENEKLKEYIGNIAEQPGLECLSGILGVSAGAGVKYRVVEDLEAFFRAVAERLIITVAGDTLTNAPKKWTATQIECVRKPMLAFGLIEEGELTDGAELRAAVLQLGEPGGVDSGRKYFKVGEELGHLVNCIKTSLINTITREDGIDPTTDTRINLVCLSAASRECYLYKTAIQRGKTKGSGHCAFTRRWMKPVEFVRPFRVEFKLDDPPEAQTPDKWFQYEGVIDHGLVKDRLVDHDALAENLEMRVSDLAINIINYSMSTTWIVEAFRARIVRPGVEYASGVISSEVLAAQRERGAGGKQPPPVLKKNNPAKIKECFTAFERCTWFDDAVREVVELYYQLKKLQVDYIVSCHIIGLLRHQNQQ